MSCDINSKMLYTYTVYTSVLSYPQGYAPSLPAPNDTKIADKREPYTYCGAEHSSFSVCFRMLEEECEKQPSGMLEAGN